MNLSLLSKTMQIKLNELYCLTASKPKTRIYLYHIRKTAGTSLIYSFLALQGDPKTIYQRLSNDICLKQNGKVFVGWDPAVIAKGNFFFAFSHMPYHEVTIPDDTFTITCLRDPVERVLSHYKMLVANQGNKEYINSFKLDDEIKMIQGGLDGFLDRISQKHLLRQLYMFSKEFNVQEAIENIKGCSYFFFADEFESGIDDLRSQLSLNLKFQSANRSRLPLEIEENTLRRLREQLEPEYQLYSALQNFKSISEA